MFLQGKKVITISPSLAVALGIFLIAQSGNLPSGFSPLVMHAEMAAVASAAPDAVCPAVQAANDKLYTTPFHMITAEAGPAANNGKPLTSEMVFVGGARFVRANGTWSPSTLSTQELKDLEQRNLKNARNLSCHYVRDEAVNGESAALYNTHSESTHGKNDNQIWISKSRGLILRQETDVDSGRPNGKAHLSIRYDYSHVQVPTP
jgi:hypothetical protein